VKEKIPDVRISVSRLMEDERIQEEPNKNLCINLLNAMELDDKESEDRWEEEKEDTEPEQEQFYLPEEWVYGISKEGGQTYPEQREMQDQAEEEEQIQENEVGQERDPTPQVKKQGGRPRKAEPKQKQWGPLQAERRSARTVNDGKIVIEKAQNLKRKVNLEENQGTKPPLPQTLSQDTVTYVAHLLDVNIGHTHNAVEVVKEIVDLDHNRHNSFSSACKVQECNIVEGHKEKTGVQQGEAPATPPEKLKAQQLEELIDALSEIVPRKRITRKGRK
jgi:hypothetical protein